MQKFNYPLSLDHFRDLYNNIELSKPAYILNTLHKLEQFSIKKNYDSYTFQCVNLLIDTTPPTFPHSSLTELIPQFNIIQSSIISLIKKFFKQYENNIYNKLNKLLFIYHEDPYAPLFDISSTTIPNSDFINVSLNATYTIDKKIKFLNIKDLSLIYFDPITLSVSDIFNKNFELKLDLKIDEILKIEKEFSSKNKSFYQLDKMLFNNGINLFYMYKNLETKCDDSKYYYFTDIEKKITMYFNNRIKS